VIQADDYRTDHAARCGGCHHPAHAGVCPTDRCDCGLPAHTGAVSLEQLAVRARTLELKLMQLRRAGL